MLNLQQAFTAHKRDGVRHKYNWTNQQDYINELSVPQCNDRYVKQLVLFFPFREKNSWSKVASVARNTPSLLIQQRHVNTYWTSALPSTNSMHRWILGNFVKLHQVSYKCTFVTGAIGQGYVLGKVHSPVLRIRTCHLSFTLFQLENNATYYTESLKSLICLTKSNLAHACE